ncbi:putative methyltransferase PMT23 [Apostasia shenzhenica]|uniref:Methyltransferase n=1 Tax=Apostasia shenzhenica TaxID=1088818 RepID=A0A2I0AIM6_9ASPA|nr:putative methyltransferase PMT23 [Apostasia shenzhenica]
MATMPTRVFERRNAFIVTLAFLLLSLLAILLFITDSSNPLSSLYLSSSKDFEPSNPTSSPPPPGAADAVPPLDDVGGGKTEEEDEGEEATEEFGMQWEICKKGKGFEVVDYIPCLDNVEAIKSLKSRRRMEHRERHCPKPNPRCLVPLPRGYKIPVPWPWSRDMIWYDNVPHPKLVDYKKDQNWVRKSGEYLVFPGGGTQFKEGVKSYIQFIEQILPSIQWGRHTRVVLDVGCGVASFGGYLLDKDVITMSFAPKDEHEAQIQFALERGIPAFLSVIGTQQLTFPDNSFDLIHCARCRVHWDGDGGRPLIELNRILRPGGYFVWSATPVYREDSRDQSVWNAMVTLTDSICWKAVVKATDASGIGIVIYQKPVSSSCYGGRSSNKPPLCAQKIRTYMSWYTPLEGCLPPIHAANSDGKQDWPVSWPERLSIWPTNIFKSNKLYSEEGFFEDTKYWEALVSSTYMRDLAINWSSIRNVIDMNAGLGGFAAALVNEPLWVMNVVPVHSQDTLPFIFNRGLIGVYHDWCEAFNTYPRTYDLLHSVFLFRNLTKRCGIVDIAVEVDRILRPGGWVLVQDSEVMIKKLRSIFQSLHWKATIHQNKFLVVRKGFWRPGP